MTDPSLPPQLAALAEPPPPALRSVALRLDPVTFARLEALRDQLNRPTRGALLRFLVREGLRSTETQLGGEL